MKILNTAQIRELEAEISNTTDLIDKAANALTNWFKENVSTRFIINIFAGTGNNGADGLALARHLKDDSYKVFVYLIGDDSDRSDQNRHFLELFKETGGATLIIDEAAKLPVFDQRHILVDAILGIGINRELSGLQLEIIQHLNKSRATKIAIDTPSGLLEDRSTKDALQANITLTIETPKLALLLPENQKFTGDWQVISASLYPESLRKLKVQTHLLSEDLAVNIIKSYPRLKHAHKGDFGKVMLVGGSKGKYGAIAMSALAALRSGCGYVYVYVPQFAENLLHSYSPQLIVETDEKLTEVTSIPEPAKYDCVAIGPGLGVTKNTESALESFLDLVELDNNIVLDADAINILAKHKQLQSMLSPNTVLTPHVGEFERLVGKCGNDFVRLAKLKELAGNLNCIVILKGAHTIIAMPDGHLFFNSTGNTGLAKAGSGDVLTGLIAGLSAQGMQSFEAALLGVYLHGKAAELAVKTTGVRGMIIEDLLQSLPAALNSIEPKAAASNLL